jgi:DNA-binding cell septation regulator SpoVG
MEDQANRRVSRLSFMAAPADLREGGLLGWVRFTLDGSLAIDGVAVRRARAGHLTLSWPARRDRHGVDHHILRPIDDVTRREIEGQVLREIQFMTTTEEISS